MRLRLAIALFVAVAAASAIAPSARGGPAGGLLLAPPPHGGIYQAAYPDFRGSEDHVRAWRVRRFERLAGKRIAWTYFSDNWIKGIRFPESAVRRIHAAGSVPFIRLMARSGFREGGPDPRYTMQRIIDGDFDAELTEWGKRAAQVPYPLLIEFGTEVNGFWFPWNGKWNGGGATGDYGDPDVPDGPERFIDAYRHVHDVIEGSGADSLTWFFHPDAAGWPKAPWNSIASYWPGDGYVDWIGVSVYGPLTLDEGWGRGFTAKLDGAYPKLAALAPDKPIAVLEYGARQGHRKAAWIAKAIAAVARRRWPRVRGLAYWHEGWRNDDGSASRLYIDSDPESLRAYRRGIGRPAFVGQAHFAPR